MMVSPAITSTPTYKKNATRPKTRLGYDQTLSFTASWSCLTSSASTSGRLENQTQIEQEDS